MEQDTDKHTAVSAESLINILDVVYVHRKTSDGGDIYLTEYGLPVAQLLELDNWYEKEWFSARRTRLEGTSAVYRVPTKEVNGRSLELVVKNCRVGEEVPVETKTLLEFINTEFNSPWEEFALTMEMREGKYGPRDLAIRTQEPLAIYVPPEKMQLWQSGRSREKINRIHARHPGIELDILRQYKLIYGWIRGRDVVEALSGLGLSGETLLQAVTPLNRKALQDMDRKGYTVADMKPCHIVIGQPQIEAFEMRATEGAAAQIDYLNGLMNEGRYYIVDYELLIRTPRHEEEVGYTRRHSYLDDQRDRFTSTPLPAHLSQTAVYGVPYIHGHVESTGGRLWVVGRNARLFDYFLPERWRRTTNWKLSDHNEVYYTLTKDNVHIVWKESRVGEGPDAGGKDRHVREIEEYGFNSPFEEAAIAGELGERGIPTVYMRAIYMTGSAKVEQSVDLRRFRSHEGLRCPDGSAVLREDRNYITVRGYFNGTDTWVASRQGQLCRPVDLQKALEKGLLPHGQVEALYDAVLERMHAAGFDGRLLDLTDLLAALDPDGEFITGTDGMPQVRICNFELVRRL